MAFRTDAAVALLRRSLEEGRLAHAYLLSGPRGSGKERVALELLALVGHPRRDSVEACRSDFVQVVRPESKSRRIRVDDMRDMEKRLYLAVPRSVTKVAVILEADRMQAEAANAFLKTLEEPPDRSLILLLTDHPEQLLETILSRCIRVPLQVERAPEPTPRETALLQDLERLLARDGAGSVGQVLALAQRFAECLREEKAEIAKESEADLKRERDVYRQTTEGDWLKRREEHHESLASAAYLRRRGELVELLVAWFGDALRAGAGVERRDLPAFRDGTAAAARRHGTDDLLRRVEALERLRGHLGTNVNETLAIEAAFLEAFAA
jgi:DNA polymerase-3 subunit delta'